METITGFILGVVASLVAMAIWKPSEAGERIEYLKDVVISSCKKLLNFLCKLHLLNYLFHKFLALLLLFLGFAYIGIGLSYSYVFRVIDSDLGYICGVGGMTLIVLAFVFNLLSQILLHKYVEDVQ